MPLIQQIRLNHEETLNNMKVILEVASKRGRGYIKDLKNIDKTGGEQVDKFVSIGFLKTGYTPQEKTYALTDLGREYFSDFFADITKK